MAKLKIEKGISRIARVKLQATIDESVAQDIALMGEWSNNDKNYLVNELLRFGLSQDSEFQAYKQSANGASAVGSARQRAAMAGGAEPAKADSRSGR